METLQLAVGNSAYATALKEALLRGGGWDLVLAEIPDTALGGVLVVDSDALDRMPLPIRDTERVVLVTHNDAEHLSRAWEAGIVSVVFENEPVSTALLAIMAAKLRVAKDTRKAPSPSTPSLGR